MTTSQTGGRRGRRTTRAVSAAKPTPRIENRELEELVGLRLTRRQRAALKQKAALLGLKTEQAFIRLHLQPIFDEYDQQIDGASLAG